MPTGQLDCCCITSPVITQRVLVLVVHHVLKPSLKCMSFTVLRHHVRGINWTANPSSSLHTYTPSQGLKCGFHNSNELRIREDQIIDAIRDDVTSRINGARQIRQRGLIGFARSCLRAITRSPTTRAISQPSLRPKISSRNWNLPKWNGNECSFRSTGNAASCPLQLQYEKPGCTYVRSHDLPAQKPTARAREGSI
jgi:hypothetical protein